MLSKCTVAKWLAWGVARLESDRYAIVPFSDSTGAPTSMVGDDRLPQFLQGSQIYGPPPGAAGAESTKPGDDSWASSNVWICCDKCNRWRRVPKGVPTPSEDEPWDCSMNTWDYRYASCAVEEEPEAHDPEMPPSGPSAEQQNAVGGFGTMASAMPLPAATNTDGAAAKAADLARTGAESPSYYTTKQGRAGAGHLLIDFRLHGKHWVLGSVHGTGTPKRRGFEVFGYIALLAAESPFHLRSKEAPPASTIASMASAMPLPAATNTDGAAAKAADLARTGAESPSYYTTKQGRAGAGHLLIDFRLHGKHWVLGSVHGDSKAARPRRRGTTRRSTVGFFFANKHRRAKTHATTAGNASPTNAPPPHHN